MENLDCKHEFITNLMDLDPQSFKNNDLLCKMWTVISKNNI